MPCPRRQDEIIKAISPALADDFIGFLFDSSEWIAEELDAGTLEVFCKIHRDVIETKILEDHSWKRGSKGGARLIRNEKNSMAGIQAMAQFPGRLDSRKRPADDEDDSGRVHDDLVTR